jgi:DNA-binding transcriptional ArsR family regulator
LNIDEMKNNADGAAQLLKQLSNPNRLWILCLLLDGELSVGEILERVELSQSALSQHLAKLREEGLVTTRRDGNSIYYALQSVEVRTLLDTLHGLYCR